MSDSTWETAPPDGDYAVDRFYTRSEPGMQTRQVRVYLPVDQLAYMEELVQGKDVVDYKTTQHIIKDAIHHRLRWVHENRVQTPESAAAIHLMQIQANAEALKAKAAQYEAVVESIKGALTTVQLTSNKRDLTAYLDRLELEVQPLPDHWKFELLGLIETYRGDL